MAQLYSHSRWWGLGVNPGVSDSKHTWLLRRGRFTPGPSPPREAWTPLLTPVAAQTVLLGPEGDSVLCVCTHTCADVQCTCTVRKHAEEGEASAPSDLWPMHTVGPVGPAQMLPPRHTASSPGRGSQAAPGLR